MSLSTVLKYASPRLWFGLREFYHRRTGRFDQALDLLPFLVDPARTAIDVGANVGAYAHRLARLASKTVAIEAHPQLVTSLRRAMPQSVSVIAGAASDENGEAILRVPARGRFATGLGTLADENVLSDVETQSIKVPCFRLDTLDVGDVGFMKIDVEGHESAVLRGAEGLLARDGPTILLEAEERHSPSAVDKIRALLEPHGYVGYMLANGRTLKSIDEFDVSLHQHLADGEIAALVSGRLAHEYVANFLFIGSRPS